MIRVREILLRDASGGEIVTRQEINYDSESIKTDTTRPDGKPLPCGSVSHGNVNLPGGFTRDVNEFDLDEAARQDAQDAISECLKAGFKVVSDETIGYPDGADGP